MQARGMRTRGWCHRKLLTAVVACSAFLVLWPEADRAQARMPSFAISYREIPRGHEMDPSELPFWASHYDLLINPHAPYLAALKSLRPAQLRVVYMEYFSVYVGGSMYQALDDYCRRHQVALESMLVHWSEPTTLTYGGETHTLPAGSRVPAEGWYGSGGDLTRPGARVVTYPGNPQFRAFLAEYVTHAVTQDFGGASYDGDFIDNTFPNVLNVMARARSGGGLKEYPGVLEARNAAFDADIVRCLAAVQKAAAPLGKVQIPNVAEYDWPAIYPYVKAVLRESGLNPQTYPSTMAHRAAYAQAAHDAGVLNLVEVRNISNDDDRIAALAQYFIYFYWPGNSRFSQAITYAGNLEQDQWYPAMKFDPGVPLGPSYALATGIDPASPVRYRGTCQVSSSGHTYLLRDAAQKWTPNELQWKTLVDAAGRTFPVQSNTRDSLTLYAAKGPGPKAGRYEVGSYVYTVMARDYSRALMLWKGYSPYVENSSEATTTVHQLPVTPGAPDGQYYPLDAQNRRGPLTNRVSLRNTQGAILVKPGTAPAPGLSISVTTTPTSPSPGDEVTYILHYSVSGRAPVQGVVLTRSLPANADYVAGSATGGGTLSGSTVIWQLGTLRPGQSGSLSYRVRVK